MKNSKKYNKLGVKLLASVLSVITFSLVTTPYAKAKEVGSGNSVVRKIKDVGSRANEFAKRGWIKISTWIKNHPKTTIAIGVVVALAVSGAVGFACYKSNKGKKEKERLEAARKAEEEAARKAEEAKKAAEEKKEEEPEAEEKPEEEKEEEKEEEPAAEEATEGQEEDSKQEPVVADEAADKAVAVEGPAPKNRNKHWNDPKQRQELLNNIVEEFKDFCTKLNKLIGDNKNAPNVVSPENLRELQSFRDKIGGWIVDLKENKLGEGFRDYYKKESGKIFKILHDSFGITDESLPKRFVSVYRELSNNYYRLFYQI